MIANVQPILSSLGRYGLAAVLVLALGLSASPALAQDGGGDAKTAALKKAYAEGMKAYKSEDANLAYTKLSEALSLANELEQQNAARQIENALQKIPKQWGNAALKNKNYSEALSHFEKGIEYSPKDAYMFYGKGLALVNLDSTDAGLSAMSQAVEVGNETGDRKTANLATERIRQEFVSTASKALNAQNPSVSDANEALSALDQMREYVEPSAKSLFYRASAHYAKSEHQKAIDTAREGLDMHRGSRTSAAKYYFVIAESLMKLGNTSEACSTFEQAAYGDYKARSEHYLENECK